MQSNHRAGKKEYEREKREAQMQKLPWKMKGEHCFIEHDEQAGKHQANRNRVEHNVFTYTGHEYLADRYPEPQPERDPSALQNWTEKSYVPPRKRGLSCTGPTEHAPEKVAV